MKKASVLFLLAARAQRGGDHQLRAHGRQHVRRDTFSLRFDHHFSEKNRVFTRFSYDDSPLLRCSIS